MSDRAIRPRQALRGHNSAAAAIECEWWHVIGTGSAALLAQHGLAA